MTFKNPLAAYPAAFGALVWAILISLGAGAAALAFTWSERTGYVQLNDALIHQLDLYAATLESELARHEYLPGIVALDEEIKVVLQSPNDARAIALANRRLASLNVRAGSLAIFVIDPSGQVRAASNWYQAQSLVGRDLSRAPFFAASLKGQPAQFFARSELRDSPEFFFAQPVLNNGVVLGIAVVKISLDPIEATWIASTAQSQQETVLVLDENDKIIIASDPAWRSTSADSMRARLVRPGPQTGLNPASPRAVHAIQNTVIASKGWRLVTMTNASGVRARAWQAAMGTGVVAAFIALLAMYLAQRRRAIVNTLRARAALQQAHDELELRIAQRTTELHEMNQELLHEIGVRKHAEQVLRESQDELLHTSKLALLGQMSAGITHEISQPLTALRSLSFNTQLLLKRGEIARIEKNLQSITDLTERMGRLTEQLKSFSRKTPLALQDFVLAKAVDNTVLLLENRLRVEHIDVALDVDASLRSMCDGNRLEQVLINLCANAIDAMRDAEAKKLTVRVWSDGGKAFIRVSDTGPGIPDKILARVFEPFFSTKLPGEGLGLGLAISADIVREFGGALRAFNRPGGAAFELDLPLTEEHVHV